MADKQTEIVNLTLHQQAEILAKKEVEDFAVSLILRAKIIAHQRRDDLVLANHIRDALEENQTKRQRNRWKEIIVLIGGSLFGAFVQGFVTELSNGNSFLVAVYVVMGFIGIIAALGAILR